jgi:hypothetical protein
MIPVMCLKILIFYAHGFQAAANRLRQPDRMIKNQISL